MSEQKEKKKILLIDDDEGFCFFVKNTLEVTGDFDVIISNRGEAGLNMAKTQQPNLILLDRMMPEMSGPKVAKFLADDESTKNIPIIFLTSLVSKDEIGSDSIAKIDGYNFLAKDIGIKNFVSCLKNFMNIK